MPNEPKQLSRSLVVSVVAKIMRDSVSKPRRIRHQVEDADKAIDAAADEIVSYIEGIIDSGDEWYDDGEDD